MTALPFTLRQLEIFEALSTTRSFRLTAEKFSISQAAVSNHIKALERHLGVQLFIRRAGKPPELSLEGLSFAHDLRPFLETGQKLAEHRRSTIETTGGRAFLVYVGLHLFQNYVRPQLDRIYIAHPDVEFDFVTEVPGPNSLRPVLSDKFDFALFHALPGVTIDEHCRIIAHCRAGIFAHRGLLPFADHDLSIEEVGELPFVIVQADDKTELDPLNQLAKVGVEHPRIVRRAHYYDVLSKLVERGVGAAYICESLIKAEERPEIDLVLPCDHWRLAIRRKPSLHDPQAVAIEDLLISCVLDDARYPAV
jgi:DNA-binding transcriptional LysR family regulator